ncbi:ImmA/IrrE family metallo-endopeptidase [Pseudidiomarina sp. E22-M8]|uniref:ImmA/IrrE family metallo-endopeptidase n=1 Tax=Pseudidiomarina sp. E22-M8 TaxID=3424768 RepID=UPI00403D2D5F
MAEAFVNPQLLSWARQRAGFAVADIASKLKVPEDKVEAWELGLQKPSFSAAQKFAAKTYIPFGFLFLDEPPEERLPLPDLRTVGDNPIGNYSLELRDTILIASERQDWYRDYCLSEDRDKLDWVGCCSIENFASALATTKELLGGHLSERPKQFDQYLRQLISRIEDIGALVMRNSVVGNSTTRHLSTDEFRGFAITDDYAPVIFINATDTPQAQLFTLIHELAHLLVGESGVSDLNPKNGNRIEIFCNRIAAEFLVPTGEFQRAWQHEITDWRRNLPDLSLHFHVSQWVIARRALEHAYIDDKTYWTFYREVLTAFNKKKKDQAGGPSYYQLINTRYSRKLASAVASEALSGRMLFRDAQHLIGVKPDNLKSFAEKVLNW